MFAEKRIRCTMALIRNKNPLLKPKNSFELIPLDQAQGSIVEQTHFFIDFSRPKKAYVCVEFNNEGPRMSDIEHYFRIISSRQLHLSRSLEVKLFMNDTIDKTLGDLFNVLNFEFKMQPKKLAQLDDHLKGFVSGISNLDKSLKPKSFRVEAYFRVPGNKLAVPQNTEATGMLKHFLKAFKAKEENQDCFESFEITYQDKEGQEQFFSLLSSKREFEVDVDLKNMRNTTQWYKLIEDDLNQFLTEL